MSFHDHDHAKGDEVARPRSFASIRFDFVLLGFFIIAGFLLFTEHRAHVLGALIYVLPFACLFMHMFRHGGHGGHGNHARNDRERSAP